MWSWRSAGTSGGPRYVDCTRSCREARFRYTVPPGDRDDNGLSIGRDALVIPAGAAIVDAATGTVPLSPRRCSVRIGGGQMGDVSFRDRHDLRVDGGPPGVAPVFAQSRYRFTLDENADGSGIDGAIDVGSVSAIDPRGQAVTYSIAGGDAGGVFAIASDGAITYTGGGEDHEATPRNSC